MQTLSASALFVTFLLIYYVGNALLPKAVIHVSLIGATACYIYTAPDSQLAHVKEYVQNIIVKFLEWLLPAFAAIAPRSANITPDIKPSNLYWTKFSANDNIN